MVFLTAQHPNYSGACIVYELCFLTFVGKEMAHNGLQKKHRAGGALQTA